VITPSKTVRLSDSALGKATVVLEQGPERRDLITLYKDVADRFESIDEFILAIDLLYVLGRVDVDQPTRVLTYAD